MHLAKALTFLSLGSGALSFKINAFTGPNCTGDSKEINVYDNTCRDQNVIKTKSFRVLAYGAGRQRAVFWASNHCFLSATSQSYWADGGSDKFKKDACITLDFTSEAYNSYSA